MVMHSLSLNKKLYHPDNAFAVYDSGAKLLEFYVLFKFR